MESESTIIKEIENTVAGGAYSDWQIGITKDPIQQKAHLGNPLIWVHWEADSVKTARNVYNHFLQKGMKSVSPPAKRATFVYILPAHTP